MKLTTGIATVFAMVSLTSCNQIAATLSEPITSDYNPLDGPSVKRKSSLQTAGNRPAYNPGQWIETIMPNATFFQKFPKANATADQILSLGTPLKVVSFKDSFVKVELESGYVGYVPQIMVGKNSLVDDNTPFLPGIASPEPVPPMAPATDFSPLPSSPELPPADLNTGGESLIPPPSSFTESAPTVEPVTPAEVRPNEILIPTSPAPPSPLPTAPESGSSVVPPPNADAIQPSIGIE